MLFKELSPTGGVLQLPKLVVGKLSTDYFEIITDFYEVVLDQSVYKVSQVYLGSDGRPKLELVPNEINVFNDILYFTGKGVTGLTSQDAVTTIANTMQTVADAFLDQSPVWVPAIEELSFLSNLELNTPRDIFTVTDQYPRKLANLLSGGRNHVKWGVGSLNEYSTAGFSLLYYGDVSNAPSSYAYPPAAKTIAIVSLNSGNNKGMVMLCSDKKIE